jgi:FdhE protein
MIWTYERRIARAEYLVTRFPESASLLNFYIHVAHFQKSVFDNRTAEPLAYFPDLVKLVKRHGPPDLAAAAPGDPEMLLRDFQDGERMDSEFEKFYARALLQPFAERGDGCPFCKTRPVAGVLRGEGEGAKRSLVCSLCGSEWEYRRVVCPNCGEEDKDNLPVYLAEDITFVRIDACDTCRTYIKSVDLTKDGHAVPVVDELASLSLTLWAEENGYRKVETNLLGM